MYNNRLESLRGNDGDGIASVGMYKTMGQTKSTSDQNLKYMTQINGQNNSQSRQAFGDIFSETPCRYCILRSVMVMDMAANAAERLVGTPDDLHAVHLRVIGIFEMIATAATSTKRMCR